MGRLFWKFFIFLWLAQLTTGTGIGALIWLKSQAPESGINAVDSSPPAAVVVSSAAATLRHGGILALRGLLEERRQGFGPLLVVVDENQHTLSGQPVSPETMARVREFATGTGTHYGVERVQADDGHNYLLFVPPHAHPPPGAGFDPQSRPPPLSQPLPPHPRSPFPPLMPIIAGALVSLVFAALLAWYFSKPIRSLRIAFEAAANGHLEQGLGSAMGNRRDELADLGRDFDRMAQQLKILMDSQRRLLHDVSHEMRSPLARLQAAIGLVRQQPERMEDSLSRIERESVRIDKLVSELLALSRLEAGMAGQLDETVDVGEVLDHVVEDARFEAEVRNCRIDLVISSDLFVRGNTELLYRAVENVVRNAVKYSPTGGVIEVSTVIDAGNVVIRVADQGSGVAEEDLCSIFKPFFRSKSEGSADGHGLGLAISQRVVESLQGRIRAVNRGAGGLCITISLPPLHLSSPA